LLLLVSGLQGWKKPDFSGEWVLNIGNSRLKIRGLSHAWIRIDHQEPNFRFYRQFIINGRENALSFELTTDGKEIITKEEKETVYTRMYWEKDILVLDVRGVSEAEEYTNTVRYHLKDKGHTLLAEEKFRSHRLDYDNIWVFERRQLPRPYTLLYRNRY